MSEQAFTVDIINERITATTFGNKDYGKCLQFDISGNYYYVQLNKEQVKELIDKLEGWLKK